MNKDDFDYNVIDDEDSIPFSIPAPLTPPKYIPTPNGIFFNPNAQTLTFAQQEALFKAKYGKSYLQMEPEMLPLMRRRTSDLISLFPKGKLLSVVDFGTSYGTFLETLPPEYHICGYDNQKEVVKYAQESLQRPVYYTGGAVSLGLCADAITMWNVLEHIRDLKSILKQVCVSLPIGGIFALSTPNSQGMGFQFNREDYESNDDPSHVWLFSPNSLSDILTQLGFKIVSTKITGYHPERWKNMPFDPNLEPIPNYGDTFELYARKVE